MSNPTSRCRKSVEGWVPPAIGIYNFSKIKESPITDVQQLKARNAAIVERLQRAYAMRESPDVLDCISELRQLSAV